MQYLVVGLFAEYVAAEAAVEDLEQAGIVGEQVQIISDPDEDARTADTANEPLTKPHAPHHGWLARLLGNEPQVRDISGEQPSYIGEQEFYANHLKQGGAVMMVRATTEASANRAAEILRGHGAHTPGEKDQVTIRRIV